jgi:hypothetical protein
VSPESDKEPPGDLVFRNIMRSHIKFLKHQGNIEPWLFISDKNIFSWYERLLKAFDSDIDLLTKDKLDVSAIDASTYGHRIKLNQLTELKEVLLDGQR